MGAFVEDYVIEGSRLKSLWIAEGFVKSNGDMTLEEEAEDYIKSLVERNLLLVRRKKYNGKLMRYSIHDLLRDLCIRKANEEKFFNINNSMRRVSVHSSYEMEDVQDSPQLMSLARSFICTREETISPIFSILRLVRVLHVMGLVFEEFPEEILQLVNLRYLAFSCDSGVPVGISRLWNLQTLLCYMSTLLRFPCSIRKLIIIGCVVFRSFLTTLCALPNLEVLIIWNCVFESDGEAEEKKWEVAEGNEFRSLQVLHLESLHIVRWGADDTNFP